MGDGKGLGQYLMVIGRFTLSWMLGGKSAARAAHLWCTTGPGRDTYGASRVCCGMQCHACWPVPRG